MSTHPVMPPGTTEPLSARSAVVAAPPSHVAALVLALATAGCGLALAGSPLLPWIEVRSIFISGNINGFSMARDSDVGWLLGPIPDGLPVSLTGLGIGVVSALVAFLSWHRPDREPTTKRLLMPLFGLIAVLAGTALVWVLLSHNRFRGMEGGEETITAGTGMNLAFLITLATGALGLAGIIVLAVVKPSPERSPWMPHAVPDLQAGSGDHVRG